MICPRCGTMLRQTGTSACRVTCEKCGYFEDCSAGPIPAILTETKRKTN